MPIFGNVALRINRSRKGVVFVESENITEEIWSKLIRLSTWQHTSNIPGKGWGESV